MKKLVILLMLLSLTGCYDYIEIDDLVILTGIILDYKDNNIEMISEITENNNESKTYKTTCTNINECISKLSVLSNKRVYLSHLKVLLLTENIINNDINYYDYFLRDPHNKMNFYIYLIDSKDKDNVFNNKNTSIYINDLTNLNSDISSYTSKLTFIDLIHKRFEYGIDPIYPVLHIDDNIILKDLKVNDILIESNDVIFYNMLISNIKEAYLTIPCEEENFTLLINKLNTNYNFNEETLTININLKGRIDNYNCQYNISNKDTTKVLTDESNKYINEKTNEIINLSKNNNYDFIGLGNYIYKHNKNYFDFENYNWNNKLNDLKTNINVNTIITSIGESRK